MLYCISARTTPLSPSILEVYRKYKELCLLTGKPLRTSMFLNTIDNISRILKKNDVKHKLSEFILKLDSLKVAINNDCVGTDECDINIEDIYHIDRLMTHLQFDVYSRVEVKTLLATLATSMPTIVHVSPIYEEVYRCKPVIVTEIQSITSQLVYGTYIVFVTCLCSPGIQYLPISRISTLLSSEDKDTLDEYRLNNILECCRLTGYSILCDECIPSKTMPYGIMIGKYNNVDITSILPNYMAYIKVAYVNMWPCFIVITDESDYDTYLPIPRDDDTRHEVMGSDAQRLYARLFLSARISTYFYSGLLSKSNIDPSKWMCTPTIFVDRIHDTLALCTVYNAE